MLGPGKRHNWLDDLLMYLLYDSEKIWRWLLIFWVLTGGVLFAMMVLGGAIWLVLQTIQ